MGTQAREGGKGVSAPDLALSAALALYGAGWVLSLWALAEPDLRRSEAARRALLFALFLHAGSLALAAAEMGGSPLYSFRGVTSGVAFLTAGAAATAWRGSGFPALDVVLLPFPLLLGILSLWTPTPQAPVAPGGSLQALHVLLALLGYALFTRGFGVGAAYWVQERRLKSHRLAPWNFHMPSLESLEALTVRSVGLGLGFWCASMALGAWQMLGSGAEAAPHPDAKMASAAAVAAVYGAFFALRGLWRLRGRILLLLASFGYVLAVVTFLGFQLAES